MDVQLVLLPFCDVPSPQLLDLKIAIRNGKVVEVEKMLQYPIDPNVAIHEACWVGQAAVLRLLLEAGAEVNLANSGGQTPLHLASMKGHRDLVQLLLGIAADVSLVDMKGKTAVQLAGDAGFSDIDARHQLLVSAHLNFLL
ncbi:Osbpl1a [Symbiodinium sp. CCMP2592]|nr:Osbpl1a [Symbiodinium sp. CCMP2592]